MAFSTRTLLSCDMVSEKNNLSPAYTTHKLLSTIDKVLFLCYHGITLRNSSLTCPISHSFGDKYWFVDKTVRKVNSIFRLFSKESAMLKVLDGCPVPLVFITLNADSPEFFTDAIKKMVPRLDDNKVGDQEKPVSVMPDIRGGCSLAEFISNDLGSLEYRLVFVRWFGKSACFGFALGAVATEFETGEDLPLHIELFEDLKRILGLVRWNGVRLTSKLLRNFDDLEIAEFGGVEWRTISIGAMFPKPISPNSPWRRQDLRIVGEKLAVVKD